MRPFAFLFAFVMVVPAQAQVAPAAISVSFGIDTTITDVGNIVRLVRAYLAKPDSSARSRGLWSTATDFDRRVGDLTTEAYQGFPATIVSVASDGPGDSVYVVRVLYASADSTRQRISPLALQRFFAVRESGAPFSFRLSGALPRLTREWEQRTKGRVTFWYAPGQHPNPAKISQTSSFVDSVASLFQVPPPKHLDMYVGRSFEEVQRAIGLDFFPEASADRGRGGRAAFGGIVLAGNPAIGEGYVHEQAEETTEAFYATAAVVVDAVYRRAGITGLRALAQLSNDPKVLLSALPAQLGLTASDRSTLDSWWRAQAARMSGKR